VTAPSEGCPLDAVERVYWSAVRNPPVDRDTAFRRDAVVRWIDDEVAQHGARVAPVVGDRFFDSRGPAQIDYVVELVQLSVTLELQPGLCSFTGQSSTFDPLWSTAWPMASHLRQVL